MKRTCLVACLAGLALCGCANLKVPGFPSEDYGQRAKQRREDLIVQYEARRDQALYEAALNSFRQGDDRAGHESLESLLRRTPDHRGGRLLSAEINLLSGNVAGAEHDVETIFKSQPDDPQGWHTLGLVREAQGRAEEALDCFRRASQLAPDDEEIALSLHAPETADGDAQPASTDRLAAAAASGGARRPVTQRNQGAYTPRSPNGAARSPTDSDLVTAAQSPAGQAALRRAATAARAGDAQAAVSAVEDALACEPRNPQIPIKAAICALRQNQTHVALAVLRATVDRFPESAELYRLCGLASWRDGNIEVARDALERALALDKSDALAYFLMGEVLDRLGEPDAAAAHRATARKIDPTLPLAR